MTNLNSKIKEGSTNSIISFLFHFSNLKRQKRIGNVMEYSILCPKYQLLTERRIVIKCVIFS